MKMVRPSKPTTGTKVPILGNRVLGTGKIQFQARFTQILPRGAAHALLPLDLMLHGTPNAASEAKVAVEFQAGCHRVPGRLVARNAVVAAADI